MPQHDAKKLLPQQAAAMPFAYVEYIVLK
jgi:hypothetical protein